MSRRKQSKPRLCKRELDDDGAEDQETQVTMATDANRTFPGGSGTAEIGLESDLIPSSSLRKKLKLDDGPSETDVIDKCNGSIDVQIKDELDDIEKKSYRCETCDKSFKSLAHFMDHRSFECDADGDSTVLEDFVKKESRESETFMMDLKEIPFAEEIDDKHPFSCQFCKKAFESISLLKHHEQIHADKLPYKCEICLRMFQHKKSCDRHQHLHYGTDKQYRCTDCEKRFTGVKELRQHTAQHKGPSSFTCSICSRDFDSSSSLVAHQLSHNLVSQTKSASPCILPEVKTIPEMMLVDETTACLPGVFQCPHCSEQLASAMEFQDHLQMHEEDIMIAQARAVQCPYCGEVCLGKEAFDIHFDESHKGQKYKCPICNAGYCNSSDLFQHLHLQHGYPVEGMTKDSLVPSTSKSAKSFSPSLLGFQMEEVRFDCPYCEKGGFSSMDVLDLHVQTLHSDKLGQRNICQYCNTIFESALKLQEHVEKNHSSRDSSQAKSRCEFCALKFPSIEGLRIHKQSCHQPLPENGLAPSQLVTCSFCTVGFLHASALTEHIRAEHGILLPGSAKSSPNSSSSGRKSLDRKSSIHSSSNSNSKYNNSSASPKMSPRPTSNSSIMSSGDALVDLANGWTCHQCNATFQELRSYQSHMKTHLDSMASEGRFTCAECGAEFPLEEQLENHVFVHFLALTTEYGCTACMKLFNKPDELQKHLMDIHAHHLYRCALCKEIFDSKVNVQVHFAIKHSNECKLYKCTQCSSVFRSEMEWQLHVKVHHLGISKPYRCLFCKDSFGSEVDMQRHLSTHKKQFECPLCKEAFHVEFLLDKHMQTNHTSDGETGQTKPSPNESRVENQALDFSLTKIDSDGERLETSPSSPTRLSVGHSPMMSRSSTSTPKKNHGDLVHKCDLCEVKFSDESSLNKHRMHDHSMSPELSRVMQKASHFKSNDSQMTTPSACKDSSSGVTGSSLLTSEKFSQICVYCNQSFKTKNELEKHMKTHVQPTTQKCNICDEVFPSATILAEHKLTHCKVIQGNLCVICKLKLNNEEHFYSHAQQHGFQGTSMQCIICRQTLATMLELQMHGKHHFSMPAASSSPSSGNSALYIYTCCICLVTFNSKENLISRTNSAGQSFHVCKPCYHGEMSTNLSNCRTSPNSELKCTICNVKCESKSHLEVHMSSHRKTYQCIKCQQSFCSEYEIQMHVATHVMQEGNSHECRICGTVYDSPAKLQCHLIEHNFEGTEMRCYLCNTLFTQSSAMQVHALEHGVTGRQFACSFCPQKFFFSTELQNHIFSHVASANSVVSMTSQANPPASLPSNKRRSPAQLHPSVHRRLTSPNSAVSSPQASQSSSNDYKEYRSPSQADISPGQDYKNIQDKDYKTPTGDFKCTECSKSFVSMANLTSHKRTHDKQSLSFRCTMCSERFATMAALQQHFFSTHTEGDTEKIRKAFKCSDCNKEFVSQANLQAHMRIHNSGKENRKLTSSSKGTNITKPVPCPICGKNFAKKSLIKEHMKIHFTQASIFACELCTETFSQSKQLRLHLEESHSHQMAYMCKVCSTNFNQKAQLQSHLQAKHGIVPENEDAMTTTILPMNGNGRVDEEVDVKTLRNGNYNNSPNINQNGESTPANSETDDEEKKGLTINGVKLEGVTVMANPPEQVTVS